MLGDGGLTLVWNCSLRKARVTGLRVRISVSYVTCIVSVNFLLAGASYGESAWVF